MLLLGRAEMLIAEAPDPLPGAAGRPQVNAETDEDSGQHHRGPRQPPFGTPAKLGSLLLHFHSLIRHGSQMSASLMAHAMTFRRACAAAALGHIGPLPVNVGPRSSSRPIVSVVSTPRLSGESCGQPSGEIPVFNPSESRWVGKKISGVSRREAIGRKVESSKGPEPVARASNGPLAPDEQNTKLS